MTLDMAILFGIIIVGLALFALEWVPIEVTALGMLLALVLSGVLSPDEAFLGFGSATVIMMLGILVLTAALAQTGVSDMIARILLRGEEVNDNRLVALIMGMAAATSSFIGNTATAALYLPVVLGISRRQKISSSLLLMPLAFATILASSVTVISTSTNVIVDGLMRRNGMAPMGMFELAPVGLPIMLVGLVYMLFVGRYLTPDRVPKDELDEGLTHRVYITELIVPPRSPMIGQSLEDLGLMRDLDIAVLRIIRGEDRMLVPEKGVILQEADSLLVEGPREQILYVKGAAEGVAIKPEYRFGSDQMDTEDIELVEVLLLPGSSLIGRTLKGQRFREQYGVQVLALDHLGERLHDRLSEVRLNAGDVLLIQGDRQSVRAVSQEGNFRVLGRVEPVQQSVNRRPVAVAIFVSVVALATFKVIPLAVSMLLGMVAMFVTRCITPEEAYNRVQWPILLLIGAMLGVGTAIETTGAAEFLANQIIGVLPAQPRVLLSAFFLLTVLLTQPMSNQAAAVVVFPVAIATALQLGLNPRTFAMMIAVAASTSFITPLEPACLLVYGPGRYKFFDFVRVGFPLTIVIYGIAIWLVPVIWPF